MAEQPHPQSHLILSTASSPHLANFDISDRFSFSRGRKSMVSVAGVVFKSRAPCWLLLAGLQWLQSLRAEILYKFFSGRCIHSFLGNSKGTCDSPKLKTNRIPSSVLGASSMLATWGRGFDSESPATGWRGKWPPLTATPAGRGVRRR